MKQRTAFHVASGRTARSSRATLVLPAAIGFLMLVLLCPQDAHARNYLVHSCRLPSGSPSESTGWSAQHSLGVRTTDSCARGGGLGIEYTPQHYVRRPSASWTFRAAPDTAIRSLAIWRYVRVHSSRYPTYTDESVYLAGTEPLGGGEVCFPHDCGTRGVPAGEPFDPRNRHLIASEGPFTQAWFSLECVRSDPHPGCSNWRSPLLRIYAARILMDDAHRPEITGVSGSLLNETVQHGKPWLEVTGTDRGSGLRSIGFVVDGQRVSNEQYHGAGVTCKEPYTRAKPCLLNGSHRLFLDTTRFADGPHTVQVTVADASGNLATSRTFRISINNGGASCPYGGGPKLRVGLGRKRQGTVVVPAGRRGLFAGRLVDRNARPIAEARVRLLSQTVNTGRWDEVGTITSDRRGRLRHRLPRGPSRLVRASYCARSGGHYRDLRLRAKPAVGFRASKRRALNGQGVLFFGRLRSGPVPQTGKLVELQAFFRGRWRTFQTLHSGRRGKFRFRYSFGGTQGTVRYRFRARVPRESGFPYMTGASRPVIVVVRG